MARQNRVWKKVRFVPQVVSCEDRTVPAAFRPVPDDAIAVAPDDGGIPKVRVVDPATGEDVAEIEAYEDAFRGGVRVALGDVTGDGVRDAIIAPGAGGGPRIKIVDGKTGATLTDFFVYEPTFMGGLYVAAGDVNGDGRDDLITGTGPGGGPRVRVLDGASLGATVLRDFLAYEGSFRGGVIVSAGDLDGDGRDDVVTGTGVGGGPRVVAFSGRDNSVMQNFFAYEDSFRGGVMVAAGDTNGDGRDDIVCGTGPGGGPVVRVVDDHGRDLARFLADDSAFRGGVRVDVADANHDGRDEVVARTRHGNDVTLRVFNGVGGTFLDSLRRTVDDNPSPSDQLEQRGGQVVAPTVGTVTRIEGAVTAVNATAGTVEIRLTNGSVITATAGPATKIERNDAHTTLAAFQTGDRAEAVIGPDGVVWEIEAEGAGAIGDNNPSDDGTPDQGGGDNSDSGSGSQVETRIEGTITAVDAPAGTVSIREQNGTIVVVHTNSATKIERNDLHVALSAFKVGDRGEARLAADGLATKLEAVGP